MSLPLLVAVMPPANDKATKLLDVATCLASRLDRGATIRRQDLSHAMEEAFGVTDATGAWTLRDAYDALEAAQVLMLRRAPMAGGLDLSGEDAFTTLKWLEATLPTQTFRSEHQVAFQQFSTPIALAWLVGQAARMSSDDTAGSSRLPPSPTWKAHSGLMARSN